eukprot:3313543-Amphidinium_carterae.1
MDSQLDLPAFESKTQSTGPGIHQERTWRWSLVKSRFFKHHASCPLLPVCFPWSSRCGLIQQIQNLKAADPHQETSLPSNAQESNSVHAAAQDPYLGAALTAPYVRGVQSEGVLAVVKHFVANNQDAAYSGRTICVVCAINKLQRGDFKCNP